MAGPHDRSDVGRVPFWIHQLVELLLGLLLLVQGARTGQHTVVLVSLGGVLLLLCLCSDGALGAWSLIGRRLHRVLDLVVVAALALSPLVLGLDHALPIVILEAAAAAMLWLAFRTEWRSSATRKAARRASRPDAAPPPAATPASPPASPPSSPPVSARPPTPSAPSAPPNRSAPLARKAGSAVGKARDDGPRQLGRLVGRAQRAAKAARAPDPGPETPRPAPEAPSEPPGADPTT